MPETPDQRTRIADQPMPKTPTARARNAGREDTAMKIMPSVEDARCILPRLRCVARVPAAAATYNPHMPIAKRHVEPLVWAALAFLGGVLAGWVDRNTFE